MPASRRGAVQLVFDGQSFNYAPTAPGIPGPTYPTVLQGLVPAGRCFPALVGLSNTTYAQRAADAATRVDPWFRNSSRNLVLDVGGPSDLIAGLTAAQILAAAESYATARKAAGAAKVIGFTVTPATTAWYTTNINTVVRPAYNALLKASTVFDAVVDMAALAHAADPSNTTYIYDGLHPTVALAAEIAALALPAVTVLL